MSDDTTQAQPSFSGFEAASDAPKRRGRPKKKVAVTTEESTASVAVPSERTSPTSDQQATENSTPERRSSRGRRPRHLRPQTSVPVYDFTPPPARPIEKMGEIQPVQLKEAEVARGKVDFEYAPTPPPADDWNPGSHRKETAPIYTGLPDPAKRPAEAAIEGVVAQPRPEVVDKTAPDQRSHFERPEGHRRNDNGHHRPYEERRHSHYPQQGGDRPRDERRPQGNTNFSQQGAPVRHQSPHFRGPQQQHKSSGNNNYQKIKSHPTQPPRKKPSQPWAQDGREVIAQPHYASLLNWPAIANLENLSNQFTEAFDSEKPVLEFSVLYGLDLYPLSEAVKAMGLEVERAVSRSTLIRTLFTYSAQQKQPLRLEGILELIENGHGLLVYGRDSYAQREANAFVPAALIKAYQLEAGHSMVAWAQSPREEDTTPCVLKIESVLGKAPDALVGRTPFNELIPYYPLERLILEKEGAAWDNNAMRVVDLLSPIGLGQRGLIVAPPRTGKTVLLQNMAHAIAENMPQAHLIVLLIDERPEEVTDFRRHVKGEVVASTFDQSPQAHVHAAEIVIAKARRMVEAGQHVIILLDSITRLARAYNALMPNSGKILSGGVEANALERPKRFFGSARNIEGGGSLTILGTALVETGSKMDDVIFEEFKGTGNMELHLDRALSEKRVFPALNFEKSGTRKEELLYHPDELQKIYALRRAMKGVPPVDAMEMLIQRVKKTKTNAEFLVAMGR